MKRLSIRWTLTLWNTAAFTFVLVVFGALVYYWLGEMHLDVVRDRLHRELTAISDNTDDLDRWTRRIEENREYRVAIWDADGRLASGDPDFADALPASLRGNSINFSVVALEVGRFALATRTLYGDDAQVVLLAHDLHHVEEEMAQVSRALLITIPFALALAAVLAFILATRALAPVDSIRRQAEAITAAKLDARVPVTNPDDELGLLARTLNDMIARLQRSFDEIRRFTADASHELRTPLAIIRSDAEIGLSAVAEEEKARERFESILEESHRLTYLTEQLLHLCRHDSGHRSLNCELVDVGTLVAGVIDAMKPIAEAKRLRVEVTASADAHIQGDAKQLRQAIVNLLDNAYKYSSDGGHVGIQLSADSGSVSLSVEDSGPGIEFGERHLIFNRFFRGKASSSGATGTGLGLSIVWSVVESHGGRIEVDQGHRNGALFKIILPRPSGK